MTDGEETEEAKAEEAQGGPEVSAAQEQADLRAMTAPQIAEHDGITVVRDDLFPGGTKARFLPLLFDGVDEVVYASPAEGGAQTALAAVGKALGKTATIFVAKRKVPHGRARLALQMGAQICQITPGHLSVVQARAKAYAEAVGARLMPFGGDLPEAVDVIAAAAASTGLQPDEVWCAAGSGVLIRGLAKAWPNARLNAVQVGRDLEPDDVAGATIHVAPFKFGDECPEAPPFPSDQHYDAKAWLIAKAQHGPGLCVFWNVTGPV